MRPLHCVATFTFCGLAPVVGAQRPARYQIAPETLRYEMENPFRMYWVRGADTVGAPQHERSVESHAWRGSAEHPELVIRQLLLNVSRRSASDTFTVVPNGRVEAINHRPPTGAQRVDLLLQLPSTPLVSGTRWSDTVRSTGTDPGGAQWYEVTRAYHVVRITDTLGFRGVADVAAEGTIRMRFGFWTDSAAGKAAWIDVMGPVAEQYLFDVERGRLLRRSWSMDLRGRGVAPGGSDTVPAGLRSQEVLALADSPRLHFLLAPVPGPDSSVSIRTSDGASILLHTIARAPGHIASSLTRNDGMVGVAAVDLRAGAVTGYSATWADTQATTRLHRISVRPDSLVVTRSGKRDTTLALPGGGRWGIADYAMEELLTPVLLAIPRDGTAHPISVFRPYPGHWDSGTVVAQDRAGLVLVVLRLGEKASPQVLLMTPDGDYLFGEDSDPAKARRVPVNAARQAQLQAALKVLKGGD